MTLGDQRLKPTDEICGLGQAQFPQGRRRQARAISLVAYQNHSPAMIQVAQSKRARRRQTPLENVPIDNQSTGERPVTLTLLEGPDVDDERTGRHLIDKLPNLYSRQANASVRKEFVDRDMHWTTSSCHRIECLGRFDRIDIHEATWIVSRAQIRRRSQFCSKRSFPTCQRRDGRCRVICGWGSA